MRFLIASSNYTDISSSDLPMCCNVIDDRKGERKFKVLSMRAMLSHFSQQFLFEEKKNTPLFLPLHAMADEGNLFNDDKRRQEKKQIESDDTRRT